MQGRAIGWATRWMQCEAKKGYLSRTGPELPKEEPHYRLPTTALHLAEGIRRHGSGISTQHLRFVLAFSRTSIVGNAPGPSGAILLANLQAVRLRRVTTALGYRCKNRALTDFDFQNPFLAGFPIPSSQSNATVTRQEPERGSK